jgi:hypothetical protein
MKAEVSIACFTAALLASGAAPVRADTGGEAEIALQGSYLGDGASRLTDVTGVAAKFRTFLPGFGFLTANMETYGGESRFRTGENYVDLNGAAWRGLRWRLTGGDFRVATSLLPFPFTNIFFPELSAEGFKVEAASANRRYSLFYGVETLAAGPRIPFRIRVPQKALGASVVETIGERLHVGARALYLSTNADSTSSYLFAPGQESGTTATIAGDLLYKASENLEFFAEAAASSTGGNATGGNSTLPSASPSPMSFTAGPVWKSHKLTVKANYIHHSASYLPIAGYFLGDRSGPYIEVEAKPIQAIELFGSASQYRNNLDNSPELPTFNSKGTSAGASIALPFRFSVSGQLSTIDFSVRQPGEAFSSSRNQQVVATLGRPIQRHNVHFSYRDLNIISDGKDQRQRSAEIEDIVQFRRFSLGGAVRDQRLAAEESKDTLFIRGSAQVQFGRLSAYAYVEHGDDLANRTVFLTNTFNTTVLGGSLRIRKAWNLLAEASQNRLTTDLNPESIFLLQNQGAFVTNAVTGLNQWTAYFRLSKSIRWGRGLPGGDLDRYSAEQMPIVGTIEGTVNEQAFAGSRPAKGIPVVLEDGSLATTNEAGVFVFSRVPEGRHRVSLAVNQLPADYDPGATLEATLDVKSRRVTNAKLSVIPLLSVSGRILAPEGIPLDNVVVKLLPTNRYTTPEPEGRFSFYNVREGEYDLVLEPQSLPEFAVVDRATVHITLTRGTKPEEAIVRLSIERPEKPIRRSFEKE